MDQIGVTGTVKWFSDEKGPRWRALPQQDPELMAQIGVTLRALGPLGPASAS